MVIHTMLVSFTNPVSDSELGQALSHIEAATRATGVVESFAASRHLAVPGEEAIPAFIGSAILQIGLADLGALKTLFTTATVDEAFDSLREDHPYSVAWVNHEPLT
jgi:hypothetical protein